MNTNSLATGRAEMPARESHVEQELNRLDREMERLGEALSSLAPRLSKVVCDPVPSPAGTGQSAPAEYRVALADRIRAAGNRIHAFSTGVEDLLSRIEL